MAREIEPPTLGKIPFLSEPFFAWWLSPWPSSQVLQLKSALPWQNGFVRTSTLECGGPHRTDEAVPHDMARKPTPLRPVHHAAGWRSGGTRALAHLLMTYLWHVMMTCDDISWYILPESFPNWLVVAKKKHASGFWLFDPQSDGQKLDPQCFGYFTNHQLPRRSHWGHEVKSDHISWDKLCHSPPTPKVRPENGMVLTNISSFQWRPDMKWWWNLLRSVDHWQTKPACRAEVRYCTWLKNGCLLSCHRLLNMGSSISISWGKWGCFKTCPLFAGYESHVNYTSYVRVTRRVPGYQGFDPKWTWPSHTQ